MMKTILILMTIAFAVSAKAADSESMKKFKPTCIEQMKNASVHFTYPDKFCDCVAKKFTSFIATVKDPGEVKDYSDYFVLTFTPGGLDSWSQDKIDAQYPMNDLISDWDHQCAPVGKPKKK